MSFIYLNGLLASFLNNVIFRMELLSHNGRSLSRRERGEKMVSPARERGCSFLFKVIMQVSSLCICEGRTGLIRWRFSPPVGAYWNSFRKITAAILSGYQLARV